MISQNEMIEAMEADGLRLDINEMFISGFYEGLCVVIYDMTSKTASVWNDGHKDDHIGFSVDHKMIEPVKTKIASLIRLEKEKKLKEKKREIVSACEGFEV